MTSDKQDGANEREAVAAADAAEGPVKGTGAHLVDGTDGSGGPARSGASPYSTGGGGVSFAQRVAAVYLAGILTGGRRAEVRELPVERVSFQTGPVHPIDDLLVVAADDRTQVTLAVACRATPNFVQSDDATVKLVGSLLEEVAKFDPDTHQVAVAAAGWSGQWEQLATLCAIARGHADPESFQASMDVDGRWSRAVRERSSQFSRMVAKAVEGDLSADDALRLAWTLLSRLHVLGFAVQSPDESDRTAVAMSLDDVAASTADGVAVRDRLEVEATRYDATGAVVDRNLLRRDLHHLLDSPPTRSAHAWDMLAEHRKVAVAGVRTNIGSAAAPGGHLEISFSDRRGDLANVLRATGVDASALVVSGESGTGKSALLLSTIAELEAADPGGFEALLVNFRALPQTSMELQSALGMSMEDVLAELSAPCRLLVIDAADAAIERSAVLLSDLVLAAAAAGVGVVAVTSDTAADFIREQITLGSGKSAATFTMEPLGDHDIKLVADHFPLLRALLRDLPTSSLFRRLVALDLLARTGLQLEHSMGEWECLELVWSKIVRGDGRPGRGSAEAREQTLLAVAAATLQLPADRRPPGGLDPAAVDALRRDHLLAPASPYRDQPQFAHDEVRRYATAILLVRSEKPTEVLEAAGVPRWAMSAATLACKGQLGAPGVRAPRVFAEAVALFRSFADRYGARWADVPVEAVFETPATYECLKAALGGTTPGLTLGDVVRVVQQRHQFNGLLDPVVSAPVVRVLLDKTAPWAVSKESFELLASWLQSLASAVSPSGNSLRIALRERLLAFWAAFPARAAGDDESTEGVTMRRQRRRVLDYQVTDDEFVESLALLGPDINEAVEACLRAIAADAPAFLAPAVDSPLSARAIALRDTDLLAVLMEAYYIDEDKHSWHLDEGVRSHQGRWLGGPPPFFGYYFGGFWQLFQFAPYDTSVRVLNNVLNHGARSRVRRTARRRNADLVEGLIIEGEEQESGAVLNLDGTSRLYVGDSHVWSWYRGTSVGPYSGMSALLAMERLAEGWLAEGVSPAKVVELLLVDCENLAVPGMLFGLLVRHLEKVGAELDPFLAEPLVWRLEHARITNESSGLRARTEGLVNLERRRWSPREACMWLMTRAGEERVKVLKGVGDKLVENGDRLRIDAELTKNWAATLDASRYQITQEGDEYYLQVVPPPEILAAQQRNAAYQERVQTSLRLQNRYWGSAKHDADYKPPTTTEIAQDLSAARGILESDGGLMPTQPANAVAHVVRAAVERAVAGEMEALGQEREFVAQFIVGVSSSFKNAEDQRHEDQYFDLGADRAVGLALPAFLTPPLSPLLAPIGASLEDVVEAGMALAGKAPLETRLYLARGCDVVWTAPCDGNPCMHETALKWLVETARGAELGQWNTHGQRLNVQIEGDVAGRLQELDGESIDIGVLDPAIRGLGSAAAQDHCCTQNADRLLTAFLDIQRRAMVIHEGKGWSADHRGTHTLVAARALLSVSATNGAMDPVREHLDVLRADSSLMSNFLHGLAAAGAENERLAGAARRLWPGLMSHALGYRNDDPNPYQDSHWGDWAAAALLPEPLAWTQGLYNELSGAPIEWVKAGDLVGFIEQWLPTGRGESRCVDALIRVLMKLPLAEQVTRGLGWIADLCI